MSKGLRNQGAGRKNWLRETFEGTKNWFDEQRSHGMYVDKVDLFIEWRARLDALMESLEIKSLSGLSLSMHERKTFNAGKKAIDSLSEYNKRHAKNYQYRIEYLMRTIGCRLVIPQRLVAVSASSPLAGPHIQGNRQ